MATHSSVLAWRISGMAEPGGLPSMGSHRVGHNWSDLAVSAAAASCKDLLHHGRRDGVGLLPRQELGTRMAQPVWEGQVRFQKRRDHPFRDSRPVYWNGGHSEMMRHLSSAKSLQSCPTLCDPIDGRPPGSPIPGILQARVLEWGAIAFSVLPATMC